MFGRRHISKLNIGVCNGLEEEESLESDLNAKLFLWVKLFWFVSVKLTLLFTLLAATLFDVRVGVFIRFLLFPSALHVHLLLNGLHFSAAKAFLHQFAFLRRVPENEDSRKITTASTFNHSLLDDGAEYKWPLTPNELHVLHVWETHSVEDDPQVPLQEVSSTGFTDLQLPFFKKSVFLFTSQILRRVPDVGEGRTPLLHRVDGKKATTSVAPHSCSLGLLLQCH